ncbi:hypothetical protein MIR68_008858 [Amoeboaphelidium protococcarum]|nr:hypothetical protein MIR68_008858 [Amoeboaphelidium protococcarum]
MLFNMNKLVQVMLLGTAIYAQSDLPPFITLQGFLRDFNAMNPDMESPAQWCYQQTGLLKDKLDANGRPQFLPPQLRSPDQFGIYTSCSKLNVTQARTSAAISNFGQFLHEEYYTDVPGVNIAYPLSIQLDLIDPSAALYQFKSTSFFPLNGLGYQREALNSRSMFSQSDRNNNYWFTTEINAKFYYRGGEVFTFTGDDDLWVFIDGKLTSCDLGSIHPTLTCSINLDSLGLLQNLTHEMTIFHAERHWSGSAFQITTSIVPINQAPIALNTSVLLSQNSEAQFVLEGYDPDYNPTVSFMILSKPSFGSISAPVGNWIPVNTKIVYTPDVDFNGEDSFQFIMNDGQANSTVAFAQISVNAIYYPPEASDQQVNANIGENSTFQLSVYDRDTALSDLSFFLISSPQFGYATIAKDGMLEYRPVNVGKEQLKWMVSDGLSSSTATITIEAKMPIFPPQPPLQSSQIAGVVVGGVAFFALIGLLLAWILYWHVAAVRFQKTWEKEFYATQMQNNPLYKPSSSESFNPLYQNSELPDK